MPATRALTFAWTASTLVISCLVLLVAASLCWYSYRRAGYRRAYGALELIRFACVALAVFLFNQPEYVEEFRPREKPLIAVVWDDSPSMQTRDASAAPVAQRDEPAQRLQWCTRDTAIQPLLAPETWDDLRERFEVLLQPTQSSQHDAHSNLFQPLSDLLDENPRLVGVVLISDGDWNTGPPPVEAATRLRLKNIPVFAIPVGSATRLPDVELLSLDAPTFGVVGKSVRVPFTVESALPREHAATVTLTTSDGHKVSEEIRIAPMARTTGALSWKPEAVGDLQISLRINPHPDETLQDNNELTAPISIREEQLQVLVVESYPRWEYRYLRNALSRDPGVVLSCLLFHPGLNKMGGGNKDYIQRFPGGLEELSKFDVIFLGDVGLHDNQLTAEQCHWIKGVVQYQATGLVFMPGWQGRQLSLLETELDELYPTILDPSQPGGWGARTPGHFELTQFGRRSLLTKLADTEEENLSVWENLPGFQWYAAVERARPGCDVLAVHRDITNRYGRMPLLVTRTYGTGKVLFMGTDGAWRWRKGVEDKYHYRFWGQVVRWMAYQRNMAKGESMRLYFTPDQPQLGQTLALHANVMEVGGEPLQKGEVTARIVSPSRQAETVRFRSTGTEWGAFAGDYTAREPGRHEVTLISKTTGATLSTSFYVQGVAEERPGKPSRPEVLDEIARVTRGQVTDLAQTQDVLAQLAALPELPPSVRRVPLWAHPVAGSILFLLLGCFWVGRKAIGLI